jgi:hypothetical protein
MMMRLIAGVVAILPAIVIFSGVIAGAETPRKHSLIEAIGLKELVGWPPNGADVLRTMHQFDLFQIEAASAAGARGDDELRQFALTQAELARAREAQVTRLNTFTLLSIDFPTRPSVVLSSALAGLQGAVGSDFTSDFYAKQEREFRRVIGLLRRYLLHPDQDKIRRFAGEQLAVLQDGLETVQARRAR